MTQREQIALYLESALVGAIIIGRKDPKARRWTYAREAGGYYYLGKSGSFRFGRNVTTSLPVAERFKAGALAYKPEMETDFL